MSACDCQYPAVAQHRVAQPLGTGGVAQIPFEYVFDRGIAARQAGIADNDLIWWRLELGGVETFEGADIGLAKLI